MTNTVLVNRAEGLGKITLSNVTRYDIWILDIRCDDMNDLQVEQL